MNIYHVYDCPARNIKFKHHIHPSTYRFIFKCRHTKKKINFILHWCLVSNVSSVCHNNGLTYKILGRLTRCSLESHQRQLCNIIRDLFNRETTMLQTRVRLIMTASQQEHHTHNTFSRYVCNCPTRYYVSDMCCYIWLIPLHYTACVHVHMYIHRDFYWNSKT